MDVCVVVALFLRAPDRHSIVTACLFVHTLLCVSPLDQFQEIELLGWGACTLGLLSCCSGNGLNLPSYLQFTSAQNFLHLPQRWVDAVHFIVVSM